MSSTGTTYGAIRQQQRLGVRCLLVHRYAHVVDHVDDVLPSLHGINWIDRSSARDVEGLSKKIRVDKEEENQPMTHEYLVK